MGRRFGARTVAGAKRSRLGTLLGLVLAAGSALAGTCGGGGGGFGVPAVLVARDGIREFERPALVALPLGEWSAMGGNWSLRRVDFSIDTRLGTREVGATWNAVSASWRWSFEPSYDGTTFIDDTGAKHAATLADGAPIPGTHWVRIDATHVATKGGLVHAFDPVDGRLIAVRWASANWPELRYVAGLVAGAQRTIRVEQCTAAQSCQLVYTIVRDASGRVIRLLDRAGRVAEFDRDASGRITAARDAKDVAQGWPGQRYEYQGVRFSAVINSEDERIELGFANGQLTMLKQVGAGDPTWAMAYQAKAAEAPVTLFSSALTDPLGNVRRYRFDEQYRLHERENARAETETWTWSGKRTTSYTDLAGLVSAQIYSDDDLVEETLPSGNVRHLTYLPGAVDRVDPLRRPIATVSDSLGPILTRQYDASGRLVAETNGAGETMTLGWGANESLVRVTEVNGRETFYGGHGEHGHPATVSRETATWNPVYDAVGNVMHGFESGPRDGGVVLRRWDEDRLLAEIVLVDQPAVGARTERTLRIERRSNGAVANIIRPLGGDTNVFYDAIGRETTRVEWSSPDTTSAPTASVSVRSHDAAGRLSSVTRPNGMRREIERDVTARIVRERYLRNGVVESDVAYTISQGRTLLMEDTNRGFGESIAYDSAGRAVARVHAGSEVSRTSFDLRSRPIRRDLENASGTLLQAVTFGYDGADRPARIGDGVEDLIVWQRTDGLVTAASFANGIEETAAAHIWKIASRSLTRNGTSLASSVYGHSPAGRLIGEYQGVAGPAAAGNSSQTFEVVDDLQPERRIASSYDSAFAYRRYAFDHASNLVRSETPEHGVIDWHYNAEANRLLEGTTAGATVAAYTWDEAGFATSRSGVSLSWTARGDLALAEDAVSGTELARFAFDPLGRRTSRTLNGTTVGWSHGGSLELDAVGNPVAADLGPVRIGLNGERVYRHTDLRGNVALRSNEHGEIRTHHSYSPYGPIETVGDSGDLEHGFGVGLELPLDASLGPIYVMGERVYDPLIGRFLAPDPVAHWVNDFAYTMGNPVEFWDPTGRSAESIDWNRFGTWLVATGATVGATAVCAGAAGSGGLAAAACVGAVIGAAGAWAQVYALEQSTLGGLEIDGISGWAIGDALYIPRGNVTVHDPEDFSGSFGGGSGGWIRPPGLQL